MATRPIIVAHENAFNHCTTDNKHKQNDVLRIAPSWENCNLAELLTKIAVFMHVTHQSIQSILLIVISPSHHTAICTHFRGYAVTIANMFVALCTPLLLPANFIFHFLTSFAVGLTHTQETATSCSTGAAACTSSWHCVNWMTQH